MERKIRILHITQAVGGGVERYMQMLLKYLDSDVYENYLLLSDEADIGVYEQYTRRIAQIDMRREIGIHDVFAIGQVRKWIRKINPDILYAHSSKAGAIVRLANLGIHKTCIYNAHGWAFHIQGSLRKQRIYTWVEKLLAPLCDKIICISESEKQAAITRGVGREAQLRVIVNGIDISAYEQQRGLPDREIYKIPVDAFVVGMVGRLCEAKAPDVFVRAAKIIKERIPNACFVMVGNGELEQEVRRLTAELSLSDSLLMTGWVENPMAYIHCFDVAMLLSRWEGFGLAIAEYMLAGKPIVASNVCAIGELIRHGENGLQVPVDDPIAAADAVCSFFSDPGLGESLTKGNYRLVREKYDVCRVAEEHDRLFRELLCVRGKLEKE